MSVPFRYPDFAPPEQTGELEWQAFQRKQQALLDSITTHSALDAAKRQQAGGQQTVGGMLTPSQEFLNNMRPAGQPVAGAPGAETFDTGQPREGMSTGDYEHLLQAAGFWGISSPESINPQALAAEVKRREVGFQPERGYQTHLSDIPTEVTAFGTAAASGLANTLANVVGDVKELPFVGDNLAKIIHADKGVEWLRRLGRNIGSVAYGMGQALPTDWDNGSFQALRATGEFAGEAVPAYFAWEAIGAAGGVSAIGKVGGRLSAFDRAAMVGVRALQGTGTAMLLEAGSNKSQEEKNQAYVAGGLLAGALESAGQALVPVLGRVIPRIRSALGIPQVMEGPRMDGFGPAYTQAPPGSSVLRTAEENADWSFIDDSPLPPRGGPGLPQGGGGGTPLLTAPVEGPGTGLPAAREPLGLPQGRAPLALSRPVNPSDVVEATYGGEDVPLRVVSPALRRTPYGATTAQIEPLNPAVAGDQITIQNYMVQNHPDFGYVDEAGRFLTPYEAAPQLSQMTDRELAFMHGSFMEAPPPVEPPARPDYGSQRFLEGKPSQGPSSSVLALTKIRHPETGMPERMYHGTGQVYDQPKTFDAPSNPENQLFGPGYYTTNNPEIASGYPPELSESDIQYYTDYLARLRDQQKSFLAKDPGTIGSLKGIYGTDDLNEIALHLQDDINFNSAELDRRSSVRPNVRPQYLDIRNPFDIDAPYTEDHVNAIALAMQKNKVPDTAIQAFIQHAMDPMSVVDHMDDLDASRTSLGEGLYGMLVAQSHNDPGVGIPAGGWTLLPTDVDPNSLNSFNQPTMQIGKALANKILEDAGFDGITHIGGFRTGNDPHRVAIAFRASQVHPAYEPTVLESLEAERLAAQMNRQQIVMDSPDLPELAGKPKLNDGDVAEAAVRANPGGVTIIKSVGMPADVMEGLKSGDVRFTITKRGNLDALVGNVTPEMAADYQEFGMFRGQRAVTSSGREIVITEPGHDYVTAVEVGVPNVDALTIPRDQITLGRSGMGQIEAPAAWEEFRSQVLDYANAEARKAGMQPIEDMRDYRIASIMQTQIQDWMMIGDLSPAEEQVMTKYFEQRWAREFRDGAPEDAELESMASIMASDAYAESVADAVPAVIEDLAETKGFVWHPNAGEGGRMEDLIGGEDLPVFSSDEAARTFLANIDRELPDLGPESDVPLEVMQHGPASQSGSALESGPGLAGPEREIDNWLEGVDAADADYGAEDLGGGAGAGGGAGGAGGGGGRIGGPPDEPNPWSGPLGPQLGPEVPGLGQRLANKIHMFMEANPDQYALWRQQVLESIVWRNRPTRYKFLAYEEHLNRIGATGNRVWDMVDNLFTALTQSHNEATPWHRRASEILAKLPRRFMRSGDFVRVHELTDAFDQERVWQTIRDRYGWSDKTYARVREASAEVKQFYRDLYTMKSNDPRTGLTAEREIWNYIPRLRAAQAAGRFQVDGDINPLIEDFATYAREGMLQMRQMDIRDLMYHSVNATFNAKYVAEPYAELVNTWQHPGIPDEVKEPVLGLARLARYGQDMGHSAAVRGMKAIFRTLGTPISTREAASMLNTPMSWNYKAMLGGRPSVLFRDAIQPLKAGLKVGMPKVMDIYRRAFSSPAFKAEMIDQGIKGGWVEVDRAQFEGAGLMEHTSSASRNAQGEVIGSNLDLGPVTSGQVARREAFARVGDVIRDAIPIRVRQANESLDPLRPYAKVSGLWNRAIAGRAGWETASGAISDFRAAQQAAIFEGKAHPTMDQLMEESAAGSFEPAIRRKFQGYIEAGQDEEAANLIARQVADWSQGRYGTKETMQFNRGYTGRLVMQFGNFAPQELESVISMARNGSATQRTKGLLGYSAINAAMYAAEAYTGWRFGKWAWAQGIAFGGGPAIDPAIQAFQAAQGMAATLGGNSPAPEATDAVNKYARTNIEDVLAPFNPYQGVLSSIDQYAQAAQGVNPLDQAARYTITGDRGGNIDWQRALEAAQRPQGHDPRYEIPPAMTKEELLRRMGPQNFQDSVMSVTGTPALGNHQVPSAVARIYGPNVVATYNPILDWSIEDKNLSGPDARWAFSHEMGHRLDSNLYGKDKASAMFDSAVVGRHIPEGYAGTSRDEQFAEAFANAVKFLGDTRNSTDRRYVSSLLHVRDMEIPGTEALTKYLADQPVYANHPIQAMRGDRPAPPVPHAGAMQ